MAMLSRATTFVNDSAHNNSLALNDDFKSSYVMDKEIGRGRFAKVCRVKHKVKGTAVAAKIIRRRRNGADTIDTIRREVAILRLSEPVGSIVNIFDVYEGRTEVTLILEYSAGGDLYHHVVSSDENLPESFVVSVMKQLLEAVNFLHSRAIVHLDIKPENILLKAPYPSTAIALCDFGLAKYLDGAVEMRDLVGTPDYVAPEILDYNPIELSSDIWSLGVVAYYLLTSESPFWASTREETFSKVSRVCISYPDELFREISAPAIQFIQRVIKKCPKERPTACDCLRHAWLNTSSSSTASDSPNEDGTGGPRRRNQKEGSNDSSSNGALKHQQQLQLSGGSTTGNSVLESLPLDHPVWGTPL